MHKATTEMHRIPGSMIRSCMDIMRPRMPAAPGDAGLHDALERWSGELEKKVFGLVQEKKIVNPAEIAVSLGMPEDVARALINRLVTAGKIRVGSVESAK